MRNDLARSMFIAALLIGHVQTVAAQEDDLDAILAQEHAERYYQGIGIRPWQISKGITGFGVSKTGIIDNKDGRYTGIMLAGHVLKEGPAARAGMADHDVIVALQEKRLEFSYGEQMLVAEIGALCREGRAPQFTLRRFGDDLTLGPEFSVQVPCERLDSLAWLPMGRDMMRSSTCSGRTGGPFDGCVEVAAKISEDRESGEFIYEFRAENTYKLPRMLTWTALDLAAGGGNPRGMIIALMPNEPRHFIVRSKLMPAEMPRSQFCAYELHEINDDAWFKEHRMTSQTHDQRAMVMRSCGMASAFLPRHWLKHQQ